ncbi:MAG TPA: hypothetical protein PKE04_02270, partial [Clostridia bacterium]|nr:hypothetical protein [Clostridia bacterium]
FIPYVTGFDLLDAVIRLSLGEIPDLSALKSPAPRSGEVQASVQMLFCRPGKIAVLTPPAELEALPGVLTAGYNYRVGDDLPRLQNATARMGYCVLATRSGDMDSLVRELYRVLRVEDARGNNLVMARTYGGSENAYA